jgi:hypothetical protein
MRINLACAAGVFCGVALLTLGAILLTQLPTRAAMLDWLPLVTVQVPQKPEVDYARVLVDVVRQFRRGADGRPSLEVSYAAAN